MNSHVKVLCVSWNFYFSWIMPRIRKTGSYDRCMLRSVRNCQIALYSGCILDYHQQYMKVSGLCALPTNTSCGQSLKISAILLDGILVFLLHFLPVLNCFHYIYLPITLPFLVSISSDLLPIVLTVSFLFFWVLSSFCS